MDHFLTYEQLRAVFIRPPQLEADRLVLRPLRMRDAKDLFSYASDPAVARYVLWDAHRTLHDSRIQLRCLIRQYRHGEPCSWGIEDRISRRLIGTIGFMWLNSETRSAEIGYSLSRHYWNQGYMTEAVRCFLDFCFDTLCLNRIEAQYAAENAASGRVMQKCGMQKEGILRKRIRLKGVYTDTVLYSILYEDRQKAQKNT